MRILILLLANFALWGAYGQTAESNLQIKLSKGEIDGLLWTTPTGKQAYVFKGVPYVEPPLGKLRFAKPVPKKAWDGTLLCHEYKSACHQNSSTSRTVQPSLDEDCLYLNLFVGLGCSENRPCPVLYYIHGGGYEYDSAVTWDPNVLIDNFASKDLIYITVGYRVGVLGFWSTGTDAAIGNYAMEDMVAGLRWVQREIKQFHGDKFKVTIMGHSSSAMAVSLLTMTPKTTGLFHQAVIMSGTSCLPTAINNDVTDYQNLAIKLNCAKKSDWWHKNRHEKIVDCMRTVDPQFMVNQFNEMRLEEGNGRMQMTVPRNDGPRGLFPYPLEQLISNRRRMTVMTGTTKNEQGSMKSVYANVTATSVVDLCKTMSEGMKRSVSKTFQRQCVDDYVLRVNVDEINELNNNSSSPYGYWTEKIVELFEDIEYFAPCHREVTSLTTKGSTVYLYSFDYEKTGLEGYTPYHSFDLVYVNGLHMFEFDERDKKIQSLYLPLFVNFVKDGNPTPTPIDNVTFDPVTIPFGFNYLSVDIPSKMKPDYHKTGVIFWNYKVPRMQNDYSSESYYSYSKSVEREQSTGGILTLLIVLCFALVATGMVVLYNYGTKYRNGAMKVIASESDVTNYNTFKQEIA